MHDNSGQMNIPPESGRKLILGLATFTLIGFSLIGLLIINVFVDRSPMEILQGSSAIWLQILVGASFGLLAALMAHFIISRKWMTSVMQKYASLLGPFNLNIWDILYVSLCAGIGEEILFRGAIQPLIGIIFTAVVFVGLHGYLNPKDARISVYGFFMVLVMIVFGIMCEHIGILSTIIAHTVIDIYLLIILSKAGRNLNPTTTSVDRPTVEEQQEQ